MSQLPPREPNPGVYTSDPPPPGMQIQSMTPSQQQQRIMPQQYQQRPMPQQYQQMGMQQQPGIQYPMAPGYAPAMPMAMNPGMPMVNPMGMGKPLPPPPLGLSVLSTISHVCIKQKVDVMEMMTGWDSNNRYDIFTPEGAYLFYCQEMSDAWSRQLWGSNRAFNIAIMDMYGRQVIQLVRDAAYCCVPPSLQVMSPPGIIIGNVDPKGYCSTSFMVSGGGENIILEGPGCCCLGSCGGAVDFILYNGDRSQEIGRISKLWSGYFQEAYSNADNFGISFPVNLSLEMKAVLIGAAILIDFQFYEEKQGGDHHTVMY